MGDKILMLITFFKKKIEANYKYSIRVLALLPIIMLKS
ncbi:TPA: hypothetical protein PDB68_001816 [Staphylococcus aureus]|nr:hypothetical protein [Staphylococcus aureus]